MNRVRWAATLGLLTGVIGLALSIAPAMSALEDSVGLRSLFLIRGPVRPPSNVTIVTVDEGVPFRLGLPQLFRDWPRSTHAALVDRLVERGASVIAFDVEFFRHGASEEDDLVFARSISRARRVVLVQRVDRGLAGGREFWERRNPIPSFADAAIGLAPVPVPDLAFISEFWSFLTTPSGDVPSIPAVALQVHATAALDAVVRQLKRAGATGLDDVSGAAGTWATPPDLLKMMQTVRTVATSQPSVVRVARAQLRAEGNDEALALLAMYSGDQTSYLNFFGPPGTICTLPYDRVFTDTAGDECPLRGSIVFVGLAHGRVARADQPDTYHTAYETSNGIDFSGVELHATALANLLTRTTLRTPPGLGYIAVVIAIGAVFGTTAYWVRTRKRWTRGRYPARLQAAVVVVSLAAIYAVGAYVLFRNAYLILPLVVPLTIQLPVAVILGLLMPPIRFEDQVRAVCLATDAEGSTALGQRLSNKAYAALLRDYNHALVRPVLIRGGTPFDPQGDGFVSVWCSASGSANEVDPECRFQACATAIEIATAAERFNLAQSVGTQLPARTGLTVGIVTVHSDSDRGVFNAFGDAVNVAARLRDLNRELGSRVIASEEVVSGLDTKLGLRTLQQSVALKGVIRPPVIFEIVRVVAEIPTQSI
jgi:adenylate cyclase